MGETQMIMLLLCSALGQEGEQPLSMSEFRRLKSLVLGGDMPDGGLTLDAARLKRLGLPESEAARIDTLLGRQRLLEQTLRRLESRGIYPLTRLSEDYPYRLWSALGDGAPPVFWCAGDISLLKKSAVAVVGSRKLQDEGRLFCQTIGGLCAGEGVAVVSGGAQGADSAAEDAVIAGGGSAIVFLADSLYSRMARGDARRRTEGGRLLMLSEQGPFLGFSSARAHQRNRYIHIMGSKCFVAQSDYQSGGTWSGTVDNLSHGWSRVYACSSDNPGNAGLIRRGATPLDARAVTSVSALPELEDSQPAQQSLFK